MNQSRISEQDSSMHNIPCWCGLCEDDQYYQCKGCLRICPYCFGGSGEFEDYCDDCWSQLSDDLTTVLIR